jgi:hypothetical protein
MVLFIIALCALIAIAVVTLAATIIGGASVLVLFGDVIVFGLIMLGLIKLFRKKK